MLDGVLSVGGEWLFRGDLALLLVHGLHFDALIMYNAMMTIFLLYYIAHCCCILVFCVDKGSEAGSWKEPFKMRPLLKSKAGCC